MGVLNDPSIETKLSELHAKSTDQLSAHRTQFVKMDDEDEATTISRQKHFLSDKLVALDRDKAEFCYLTCRATNAHNIVEVGTSFGVSTIYLAAAVRDNLKATTGSGRVIATEYETIKVDAARKLFAECGLDHLIDLRPGDLRETLRKIDNPVDFVLVDIWTPMARPAIELIYPKLRSGAIVVCDNTGALRANYEEYLEFINDPSNGFRTMTLPFDGGLEMSVRI